MFVWGEVSRLLVQLGGKVRVCSGRGELAETIPPSSASRNAITLEQLQGWINSSDSTCSLGGWKVVTLPFCYYSDCFFPLSLLPFPNLLFGSYLYSTAVHTSQAALAKRTFSDGVQLLSTTKQTIMLPSSVTQAFSHVWSVHLLIIWTTMKEDMEGPGTVQPSKFTREYRANTSIRRMSATAFKAGNKIICFYFLISFSFVPKLSLKTLSVNISETVTAITVIIWVVSPVMPSPCPW